MHLLAAENKAKSDWALLSDWLLHATTIINLRDLIFKVIQDEGMGIFFLNEWSNPYSIFPCD
jgi:hypothetical protein